MIPTPAITVALLTWNGAATLPACLASLAALDRDDWLLVALDNGSSDGSVDLVAAWSLQHLPSQRVKLARVSRNTGYAAGMNALFALSEGPAICALNQDVALAPSYLTECLAALGRHPEWGSCIGQIRRVESLERIESGGGVLDSTGHVLFRDRIVMNRDGGLAIGEVQRTEGEVFGVPGMCPVYRRSALEAIANPRGWIWDERFFAYLEDVDLDYRLRRRGFSAGYVPAAQALHQPHGSGGRASFAIRFRAHMNRYRVLAKHESFASLLPDLGPLLVQECYQCLRTTFTNPLLHIAAFPFLYEWLTLQYRGGPGVDRRWIEAAPRWRR